MAKTRWYNDRLRDPFFKAAKKQGYRARSAYKLKQIQNRFHVVKSGQTAVDLGAAPGGWTQVLVELIGDDGIVVGLDLRRIAPIPGARLMQGDFTRKATHEKLAWILRTVHEEAGRDVPGDGGLVPVDVVLSDMAPDMSGNYTIDQARSVHLCEMAVRFADGHLRAGGNFVCKIFEGEDFHEFREMLRGRFARVFQFHPPASRKQSSEVYLVGKGFRRDTVLAGAADDSEE